MERGIRNLGEATELTTGELRRMAGGACSSVTTFGDEAILEMQSLLLTFREVGAAGPAAFRRITGTVLDMAVVMGMDAPSAARQLALALEDPERGLSQLRRSGTTFTDAQKDMIVAFAVGGERARAFGSLLDIVEGQVGGAARTVRGTLGGALDALGTPGATCWSRPATRARCARRSRSWSRCSRTRRRSRASRHSARR